MDAHVKEGQLYVQHQKFGKKWKKNWFVLYPASPHGIARLECYDSASAGGGGSGGGPGGGANEKTRKLDKKIIRLSDCISILPAVMEACPKDNMLAFCVETNAKTHVFAAESTASMEWVEKMCEIAFKGGSGSGTSSGVAVDPTGGTRELQMSENLIYSSREEVDEFWVSVQPTEAADRCGLVGPYYLKADREALVLKDPKTRRGVLTWPYKLLRRYGRDRVMFSFEAGRRCESGPGKFTFDTKQGNEIFQLVEQAIQSQKVLAEERSPSLDPEGHATLLHLRGLAAGAAGPGDGSSSRESDGDSGGSKPNSADGVLGRRDGADAKGAGSNKGRSLPDPPSARGPAGPRPGAALGGKGAAQPPSLHATTSSSSSSSSTSLDDPGSLYSEPVDSLRLPAAAPLVRADALYSDPVDLLMGQGAPVAPTPLPRLRPQGDEAPPPQGDLYSYLSNQVNLELSHKTAALGLDEGRGGGGGRCESSSFPSAPPTEHIYDEPEGCARGARGAQRPPAANLYDTACPEPRSYRRLEDEAPPSQRPRAPGPKPPRLKPFLAPKPGHLVEPLPPPPLKPREVFLGKNVNNNNNNNVSGSDSSVWAAGAGSELYSKVSKQRPPSPGLWFSQQTPAQRPAPPLRTPDLIYDNLGDI